MGLEEDGVKEGVFWGEGRAEGRYWGWSVGRKERGGMASRTGEVMVSS